VDHPRLRVRLARWIHEIPYELRYVVNAYPLIYMPLARVRHRDRDGWTVRGDTELVIEGFGRSGSTFVVDAFEIAQSEPVRLAHHTHAAAQVITAARMRIPTLVIVRRPDDVTTSHMVRRGIGARPALSAWIRYHRRILPFRDHVVSAPFERVTSDLGSVIREVNERFGTDYDEFESTEENLALVLKRIEDRNRRRFGVGTAEGARSLARPTPEREQLKGRMRAEYDAPALAGLRQRADRLYWAVLRLPAGP
jgi:hypothetical protein